jgi:hypothetical protein
MWKKLVPVCVGGVIVLWAALLVGGRYETTSALNGAVVRTDRLTGEIRVCDGDRCWDAERGARR